MKIKMYQADAFTDKLFGGNPAAVCLLDEELPYDLMQKIAAENNLAETAFVTRNEGSFGIRWCTPKVEVDLCGHATLASAHVIFHHLDYPEKIILFSSRSGILEVRKEDELLILNFPSDILKEASLPDELIRAIGMTPSEILKGKTDYLLVYENQQQVEAISPDFAVLSKATVRGIIVTAKGDSSDFVSRFFAPAVGVNEDPVTGSAHTTLIPYWSARLGKKEMTAIQLSERRGYLQCNDLGERVEIAGKAVTYLVGEIFV
ncbi:MAG: PhzF family phenazine biosynthesis protein [Bacteroidetes bacterium]|nr:PhzF family phenazine biosynthesis protein [Bacteroidota bacterium]